MFIPTGFATNDKERQEQHGRLKKSKYFGWLGTQILHVRENNNNNNNNNHHHLLLSRSFCSSYDYLRTVFGHIKHILVGKYNCCCPYEACHTPRSVVNVEMFVRSEMKNILALNDFH